MKCPKCGCENDNKNAFCKECGEPLKAKKSFPGLDIIKSELSKDKLSKRKIILLGVGVIVLIAIISMGINSLGIGYPAPGNEAIINIESSQSNNSDGDINYHISFTLTNAPKDVNKYSAKVTWYGSNGEVLMTDFEDLKYTTIEDDHTVDIYVYKNHSPIDINECVIEITNNQGELVTSANYKWVDNWIK